MQQGAPWSTFKIFSLGPNFKWGLMKKPPGMQLNAPWSASEIIFGGPMFHMRPPLLPYV